MLCPMCLSVMRCESERHAIGSGGYRMDLHCFNVECPTRTIPYGPHMGVLAYPSQIWICNSYHLPFRHEEEWYAMVGEPVQVIGTGYMATSYTSLFYPLDRFDNANWKWKNTVIYKLNDRYAPPIFQTLFVPISTNNDMHQEAEKLFRRLIKLVVFS